MRPFVTLVTLIRYSFLIIQYTFITDVACFYLFADETNMYYESKSLIDMEKTITKELSKLYLWLNIKEQCFIKYLGVLIDSKLSRKHVSKIFKMISRSLGIMYELQSFLPLKIMKNVYYSLIYSHLVYGIEVWGSACKTELNKLLVPQKRAMRLMT